MSENEKFRKQLNIRLEPELYDFLVNYSKSNYKTVTAVVRELIVDLYSNKKLPVTVENK